MKVSCCLFLFYFFSCLSLSAQQFVGRIEYRIQEGFSNKAFHSYFFNNSFVKRIDTTDNFFTAAGFLEVIWDIKKKTQYIINHGNKTIYYYDYSKDTRVYKPVMFSEIDYLNKPCLVYKDSTVKEIEYLGQPDIYKSISTYTIAKDSFSISGIKTIPKFCPLNFQSGYIPLKQENSGGFISKRGTGYKNTIFADHIERGNIADSFFSLPESKLKPYDEEEIKHLVELVVKRKINFLQMAKDLLRKSGKYNPVFDITPLMDNKSQ